MASDLVPFTGTGSGIRRALINASENLSDAIKAKFKLKPSDQSLDELGDYRIQEVGTLRQTYNITGGNLGTSVEKAVITIITRVKENEVNAIELIKALRPLIPQNDAVFGQQGITSIEPGDVTIEMDDAKGEVVTATFEFSIQATADFS